MTLLADLGASHWLVLGLLLLAAEAGIGIGYLLGPGLAALLIAVVALLFPGSAEVQLFLFALASVAITIAYIRYFRDNADQQAAEGLHDRTASMIGHETRLAAGIEGNARIPFGDTLWRVFADRPIATGKKVRVTSVTDGILQIEEA